ncbi:hypothetical protein [Kamptonema formosum]|uniref:hypothetical protein n=1 Tax=Kamptonema formosum TaxID=331992 RepID=UPI00034A7F9D|nr:hypothetical protein [Oscillatoria sp. PCC 10802]
MTFVGWDCFSDSDMPAVAPALEACVPVAHWGDERLSFRPLPASREGVGGWGSLGQRVLIMMAQHRQPVESSWVAGD